MIVLLFIPMIVATSSFGNVDRDNCINLLQTCVNCTYINGTILYPDSTIAASDIVFTRNNNDFTYNFCNTSVQGIYQVNGYGNPDGVTYPFNSDFVVGRAITTSQSITYIIIFIVSLLIFGGLMFFGIFMPVSNKRDEFTGYVIAVENLKYLKFFSLMFAYLVGLFLSYFSYYLSYNYLNSPVITQLFFYLFWGMTGCTLLFFPLMIYFLITNWIKDTQVGEMLSRGLSVR